MCRMRDLRFTVFIVQRGHNTTLTADFTDITTEHTCQSKSQCLYREIVYMQRIEYIKPAIKTVLGLRKPEPENSYKRKNES